MKQEKKLSPEKLIAQRELFLSLSLTLLEIKFSIRGEMYRALVDVYATFYVVINNKATVAHVSSSPVRDEIKRPDIPTAVHQNRRRICRRQLRGIFYRDCYYISRTHHSSRVAFIPSVLCSKHGVFSYRNMLPVNKISPYISAVAYTMQYRDCVTLREQQGLVSSLIF